MHMNSISLGALLRLMIASLAIHLFGFAETTSYAAESQTKTSSAESLESGKYYRARCYSRITGTNVSLVYGSSKEELQAACARQAVEPQIAEIVEMPCAADGEHIGCEAGTPSSIVCSGGAPKDEKSMGSAVKVGSFETRRACVRVPKAHTVTTISCRLFDNESGSHFCKYSTGTDGCPYAASKKLTVAETSTERIYCWTVFNESHDRSRWFSIGAE